MILNRPYLIILFLWIIINSILLIVWWKSNNNNKKLNLFYKSFAIVSTIIYQLYCGYYFVEFTAFRTQEIPAYLGYNGENDASIFMPTNEYLMNILYALMTLNVLRITNHIVFSFKRYKKYAKKALKYLEIIFLFGWKKIQPTYCSQSPEWKSIVYFYDIDGKKHQTPLKKQLQDYVKNAVALKYHQSKNDDFLKNKIRTWHVWYMRNPKNGTQILFRLFHSIPQGPISEQDTYLQFGTFKPKEAQSLKQQLNNYRST